MTTAPPAGWTVVVLRRHSKHDLNLSQELSLAYTAKQYIGIQLRSSLVFFIILVMWVSELGKVPWYLKKFKMASKTNARFFLCSTSFWACLAEHLANQLSPSSTVISLVWTSFPGMNAKGPNGTCYSREGRKKGFKINTALFKFRVQVTPRLKSFLYYGNSNIVLHIFLQTESET